MTLREYFEQTKGIGVLATTDASGQVNQAIYAKPMFLSEDDDTCAFLMSQRLSHDNVLHNPSASYLFLEQAGEYVGKRVSLTATVQESDPKTVAQVYQRFTPPISKEECKYLVHFHIDGVRPLIGNG